MHTTAIESDQCIRPAFMVNELARISAAGEVEGFAAMPHQEVQRAAGARRFPT